MTHARPLQLPQPTQRRLLSKRSDICQHCLPPAVRALRWSPLIARWRVGLVMLPARVLALPLLLLVAIERPVQA